VREMGIFDGIKIGLRRRQIEQEIREKEEELQRELEEHIKNTKIVILNRFKKRQLDAIAAIKGLPKTRTKAELVKIMADSMDLEEIKKFARNYKIQYRDIITALEKYKKSLDEELGEFKARKWAEFEEFKRELTGT